MTKIIILQQLHPMELFNSVFQKANSLQELDLDSQNIFIGIAKSQHAIAKILQENKNVPVIGENFPFMRAGANKADDNLVKKIFPKGIPSKFESLSFAQKKHLAMHSGLQAVLHTHAIEQIYPDNEYNTFMSNALLEQLDQDQDIDQNIFSKISQQREYNTLQQALEIAAKYNSDTVIIVYGTEHFFTDVATCVKKTIILDKINTVSIQKEIADILYAQEQESHSLRPAINCNTLQNEYKPNPPLLLGNSVENSVSNTLSSTLYGNALLVSGLGLVAYGFYSCFKNKKKYGRKKIPYKLIPTMITTQETHWNLKNLNKRLCKRGR